MPPIIAMVGSPFFGIPSIYFLGSQFHQNDAQLDGYRVGQHCPPILMDIGVIKLGIIWGNWDPNK